MTVISALISKKGVSVATDSMLTVSDQSSGNSIYVDWNKSKIIPVPKLYACISYWGFAGTLEKIPKSNEQPKWNWQTFDWLRKMSVNPKQNSLEDFSKFINENLTNELNKLNVPHINKGIGLHITGIEQINGYPIPELFLICNYLDLHYQKVGNLSLSRNTFHTIWNVPPSDEHNKSEFRIAVKRFLEKEGLITYNNGDPEMFNLIGTIIDKGFKIASNRKVLKKIESIHDTVPMVKRPIEIISEFQRDFYNSNKKLVGGRIHDYSIANNGLSYSTSGDK